MVPCLWANRVHIVRQDSSWNEERSWVNCGAAGRRLSSWAFLSIQPLFSACLVTDIKVLLKMMMGSRRRGEETTSKGHSKRPIFFLLLSHSLWCSRKKTHLKELFFGAESTLLPFCSPSSSLRLNRKSTLKAFREGGAHVCFAYICIFLSLLLWCSKGKKHHSSWLLLLRSRHPSHLSG